MKQLIMGYTSKKRLRLVKKPIRKGANAASNERWMVEDLGNSGSLPSSSIASRCKRRKSGGIEATGKKKLKPIDDDDTLNKPFHMLLPSTSKSMAGKTSSTGKSKRKLMPIADDTLNTPFHMLLPLRSKSMPDKTSSTATQLNESMDEDVSLTNSMDKQLSTDDTTSSSDEDEDVSLTNSMDKQLSTEDTTSSSDEDEDVSLTNSMDKQLSTEDTTSFSDEDEDLSLTNKMDKQLSTENTTSSGDGRNEQLGTEDTPMNQSGLENHDTYETNSINETVVGVKKSQSIQINVHELLIRGGPFCAELMKMYDKNHRLNSKQRVIIMDVIILYSQVNEFYIDPTLMAEIVNQICQIFPTEVQKTYFDGKSGKLYYRYHNSRRGIRELKKQNREKSYEVIHVDLTDDVADSMELLKRDGEAEEFYVEHWNRTFEYRVQKFSENGRLEELINEWPIITKPLGHSLINLDFNQIHGDISINSCGWNSFFSKNWFLIKSKIKNKDGKTLFKEVAELEESISKDASMLHLLHYLLPPAYSNFKIDKPKASFVDSQDSMLKYMGEEDIDVVIKNRITKCLLNDIEMHPYIVGYGASSTEMLYFYVVFHDQKILADSFLSALDLCLKIFVLFNIPYPAECKAVWILINKLFYNVNIDSKMSSRIWEIYNDFK